MFVYLIITSLILILIYLKLKKSYRYWHDKGVPYLEPNLIFGNITDLVIQGVSDVEHHLKLYNKLAPHKFGGYFILQTPALLVRDPELIKHILTKDFIHFYDRSQTFVDENDILSHNLFNLDGEKWKTLRAKLTPTFTSGKMKLMFNMVKEHAELLAQVVKKEMEKSESLEMKDFMSRFTIDVISTCAFGLQAESLAGGNAKFRQIGNIGLEFGWKTRCILILSTAYPILAKLFSSNLRNEESEEFFLKVVNDTIKYRESNNITTNDFLNLLMNLRKHKNSVTKSNGGNIEKQDVQRPPNIEMTPELMAAQCFSFFIAGFETSSALLSFCLLELAKNTKIQQKLLEELKSVLSESNGEMTYDALKEMVYMDQIVAETMRMYPALPAILRQCTKKYRIPETDIIIEEGTEVSIPVYGIHRDPQYYPNPDSFNPENFSEKNKELRHHYAYLPFGEGPRICIGMRFGLMQVKIGLATLLLRYRFTLSPKMELPIQYKADSFITNCTTGIWLNCCER